MTTTRSWPRCTPTCTAAAWSPSTRRWWSTTRPASVPPRPRSTAISAGTRPVPTPATPEPEFANGPRAGRLAAALRLDLDPRSPAARRAIEVYPHAATVALFRLERTLKYKAKPGRTVDGLKSELLLLMDGVERLSQAQVPLVVAAHDGWIGLRRAVAAAQRRSELRRAEDPVDAVVCAYVALYAQRRPGDVTIYGDVDTGYIVTPSLPADPVRA